MPPRCSMPPTPGRCARPVARRTRSEARPTIRPWRPRPCQNRQAFRRRRRGSRSRGMPNRMCLRTSQHPHDANVAHGSGLGVHPDVVAGPDYPLRERFAGEAEDRRRHRGPRSNAVQRFWSSGLARWCDPKAVVVVGEDRVRHLRHPYPLKDSTSGGRDPHEVNATGVVPFVEPEIAAAIGPCRRRVGPRQRRKGHHDGTEPVPR